MRNIQRDSFDMRPWMDAQACAAFDASVRPRRFTAGQIIYQQGEVGSEMFRIVQGSVRLSVGRPDGREIVFLFFRDGDCFGVSSLIDSEPRPQTAEVVTDTLLDVLDARSFSALRVAHRGFESALLQLLARQMRVVSAQFVHASLSDLIGRVVARLLDLGRMGSIPHPTINLSQAELASMVGASRQGVNRALQQLQSDGYIVIEAGRVTIIDVDGLAALGIGGNLSPN